MGGFWIGAAQANPRPWHVVGMLAHVVPITVNIIFFELITSSAIGNAAIFSLTFHCVASLAEMIAWSNLMGWRESLQAGGTTGVAISFPIIVRLR